MPQNPNMPWKPPGEWYVVLEGVPKSPPGWYERQPVEDAIVYIFPLARLQSTTLLQESPRTPARVAQRACRTRRRRSSKTRSCKLQKPLAAKPV